MENLFFVVFYIGIGILSLLIIVLAYKLFYYRDPNMTYNVACAGSPHNDTPKEKKSISVYSNEFLDENGMSIDVEQFDWFIASGASMHLTGINDGDIVFIKKGYVLDEKEDLPVVFVLKRDKKRDRKKDEEAQFKIRRGWKFVDYVRNETDMNTHLESIMRSDKFREIIKEKNKDFYPGDDAIKQDFFETRLPDYIKKYEKDKNGCNRKVMISTTLHTDENKIYFSIHPTNLIKGKVSYSFTVKQNN